jgi:hypothetical protein
MPTVLALAAELTRQAARDLERVIRAMPPDRLTWSPPEGGRTALDQLQECAILNYWNSDIMETRAVPPLDWDRYNRMKADYDTVDKALVGLQAGAEVLVAALETFDPEHLDDTIVLPFGGGLTRSLAMVALLSYWNMTYHLGQMNYIQTLYGDREMH